LYFNFFSDSFCITLLSDGTATSISKQILSFLFLIIMTGLFSRTSLSLCTPWFHSTVISSCWHTYYYSYYLLFSFHSFFRYFFSWTSGEPHHSGFKFLIVALSL
jgi:hypothetical protein